MVVAGLVAMLGGCGGSGQASAPQGAQLSQSAPVHTPGIARPTPGVGAKQAGLRSDRVEPRSFQALADDACTAVVSEFGSASASSPPQGSHAKVPASEANATASKLALVQREIGELTNLRPPASLRSSVGRLVGILNQLRQLYLADVGGASASLGGAIVATEQQSEDAAMVAGVPACASSPRSRPGSPVATPPAAG